MNKAAKKTHEAIYWFGTFLDKLESNYVQYESKEAKIVMSRFVSRFLYGCVGNG